MPPLPDPPATIEEVARDPWWLAHRYDPEQDAMHFLRLDRTQHGRATFLIDRDLPPDLPRLVLPRSESVRAASGAAGPVHFIFHSAYCCSTLLARAFDLPGTAWSLREPTILNDLVGWRRRGAAPAAVQDRLADALTLLERPFGRGEAVVVKPSNVVNALAPAIMALRPGARALLLHAPLPVFLRSIAKKGMWGALWVREYLVGARKDGLVELGFSPEQLFGQTDLQIAALGWLAQHALFARLTERFGPERVRTIDSERLLSRPAESLAALGRLFALPLTDAAVEGIVQGPVFSRHSKEDKSFDTGARQREHEAADQLRGEEVEKVSAWIAAVAAANGVPLALAAPLLPEGAPPP